MAERFIIRTEGGPHPGDRVVDDGQYQWPLPGTLGAQGGRYFKVSESDDPPQEEGSRFIRSACYQWFTDAEIEEAKNATA